MNASSVAGSVSGDNRRAAILMIGAMAAFAVEDTFLKRAAVLMPPGQVLVINGLLGGGIFALLAMMRGERARFSCYECGHVIVVDRRTPAKARESAVSDRGNEAP